MQLEGENSVIFRAGTDNTLGAKQIINGNVVTFEDADQLQLGSLEYEKNYSPVFPNGPTTYGNDYYGSLEIIFKEFIYFQGAGFRTTGVCRTNATIEAGRDANAYPLVCAATYSPFHEVNKCVKVNSVATTICEHDMDSENSKCYRCQRGYGNLNTGTCSVCSSNCLACKGSGASNCIYCDIGYGFTGSQCAACVDGLTTFDANLNVCQAVKQHNRDMWGNASTIGDLRLFFVPLNDYSASTIHVETYDSLYWLKEISKNYYVIRSFSNIPLHRKFAVTMELMVIDLVDWEFVFVSIDGKYVKQINSWRDDYTMTSNFLSTGYSDWRFTVAITDWHSASTMSLAIVGLFSNLQTNIWIRNVQVDFFGCFSTCKDCWVDNSPLSCTDCLDGYYLNNFQCKVCDASCLKCVGTSMNCTSCLDGKYLKLGICTDKCGLGFYINSGNVCYACPSQCTQCLSATNCISCQTGLYLNAGACLACSGTCLTCKILSTNCTSCLSPKLLQDGACVNSCSSNYYLQDTNCIACPNGCAICNKDACLTCLATYRFKGTTCANPCGNGYYIVDANNCGVCNSSCTLCSSSANNCSECKDGYYLSGNSCVLCSSPCENCTSATSCLTCVSDRYLKGTSCLESCGDNFYGKNKICYPCDTNCNICNSTECTACLPNFFLRSGACYDTCVDGYFKYNNGVCCPNACESCTTSDVCLTCKTGFYLSSNKCLPCKMGCSACETTADNCSACSPGYYIIGTSCESVCPETGYFVADSTCKKCDESCNTCSGSTAADCLTCLDATVFFENKCYKCGVEGSPFDLQGTMCVDRCGDGRKFSIDDIDLLYNYNACDDGNTVSGDGCSSTCQIEANFDCQGGTITTKDTCHETIPPTVSLIKFNDLKFQLKFSEPVKITEDRNLGSALVIGIKQYENTEKYRPIYDSLMMADITTVDVQMVYQETFANYTLTFDFNRDLIRDYAGNKLRTIKLKSDISFYLPERSTTEIFTNTTAIIYNFAYYLGAAVQPVLGTYISSSIAFAYNDALRASYYVYANSQVNTDVEYMLYGMSKISSGASDFIPFEDYNSRLLIGMDGSNVVTPVQPISLFISGMVTSPHKIFTNLSFLLLLASVVALFSSKLFVERGFNSRTTVFRRWLAFWINRIAIYMIIMNFIPVLFSCSVNLVIGNTSSKSNSALLVLSMLMIAAALLFIVVVFYIVNKPVMTLWHPFYYNKYNVLYAEFKLDKRITKVFIVFYLLKNLSFACLLGFMIFNGSYQTLLLFCLSGVYLGMLIKFRPYINLALNIFAIAVEVLEMVFTALLTINNYLYSTTNNKIRDATSHIMTAILTMWLMVTFLRILFTVFLRLRREFKNVKIALAKATKDKAYEGTQGSKEINNSAEYISNDNVSDTSRRLLRDSSGQSLSKKSAFSDMKSEEDRGLVFNDKDLLRIQSSHDLDDKDSAEQKISEFDADPDNMAKNMENYFTKDIIRIGSDELEEEKPRIKPTFNPIKQQPNKAEKRKTNVVGFDDDMMKVDDDEV